MTRRAEAEYEAALSGAGLSPVVARVYARYHRALLRGLTGHADGQSPYLPGEGLAPAAPQHLAGAPRADLSQLALIKLNGGLGTTMGLQGPKGSLKVKAGLSFLEIAARHARAHQMPLVLMSSFATRDASRAALAGDSVVDFVQHRIPKVDAESLGPARWPRAPHLEWAPPGHGDFFLAFSASGMLDALLRRGLRYAFVSNIDNLGASADPEVFAHFVASGSPFMMEVTRRTAADRKGGHLARCRRSGGLILRERAQCPPDERADFEDIERYGFFNTNNIWLDLRALRQALTERAGSLHLPLIRNDKTVDPRDPTSPPVHQIETAIGAAIGVMPGAIAVEVPRSRFMPVKTTGDLLVMRSNATRLTADWRLERDPTRRERGLPRVWLDPRYFGRVDEFEQRFAGGLPDLSACRSLRIDGPWSIEAGAVLCGDVVLERRGTHGPRGARGQPT